jgi:predicted nuclease of predicted toxin-antitoxin system
MKLLIDMNLSPRWVRRLRAIGLEASHWTEIGSNCAPDVEIMRYARDHDYVLLTHDLDFGAILAATQGEKPSVVQIRSEDVSPDTIGKALADALLQMAEELRAGALLTVEPKRTRLRLLPLKPL